MERQLFMVRRELKVNLSADDDDDDDDDDSQHLIVSLVFSKCANTNSLHHHSNPGRVVWSTF